MASTAVCYVTDKAYLFPTLMSAVQARHFASRDLADIFIFSTCSDERVNGLFAEACRKEDIQFRAVGRQMQERLDQINRDNPEDFSQRISVTAFGRLFLDDLLPSSYEQLLYLDGDTQIVSSLDPLLTFDVPPGKFLAARDYCALANTAETDDAFRDHLDRQQLPPDARDNYFNSGVIRAGRQSWAKIADNAIAYYLRFPERCHPYHDQGALNGSGHSSHMVMSARWNFPRQFQHLDTAALNPVVYHFMANPKPWHGHFHPWSRQQSQCYVDLARRHPDIAEFWPRLSLLRRAGYTFKSIMRRLTGSEGLNQTIVDTEAAAPRVV